MDSKQRKGAMIKAFRLVLTTAVLAVALATHAVSVTRAGATMISSGPGDTEPLDLKQAINDFVAKADEAIGAEEIVSFLNSNAIPPP
jgi:hypothetical protein